MGVLNLGAALVKTDAGAKAPLNQGYQFQIDVLEPWLCRVSLTPDDNDYVANTWMVSPSDTELAWQGRDRLSTGGFSLPSSEVTADGLSVQSDRFDIEVQPDSLALSISRHHNGNKQILFQDRPMHAYRTLPKRSLIQHAQSRDLSHLHLGMGDKAGTLDKSGKRFRILQTDALGYNAENSDPLYKHVPWIITGNNAQGYCGIFYDTFAELNVDLGAEHSNYHAHYRVVEAYEKALVYYIVDGPTLLDVVSRFQWLIGKPHLQPRWAMGFAHTSMHLADADNAQSAILDFAEQSRAKAMPLSAVHSGSGYTTRDDGRRYVFTWNTKKFPDKNAFFKTLNQTGLYSCANIKPVLLCEHPLFNEVAEFGGFIKNENGEPAIEMFWGGPGASLDFTHPKTVDWWKAGVTEQVLGAGFSSSWNDNNECEIWDEQATVHGFGESLKAMDVRPIQALLMLRASFEAAVAFSPNKRPYTISRGGPVGLARYAQTWSGDNKTSWHTLEWNMANGLSMTLSGLPFVGHDIGGFDGPKPTAELLCRWVEMMCLHPRAVMNSWKPQETDPATLPWMHESVEDHIRSVLTLRYRFLPWLYHLSWRSHTSGEPMLAPMMLYFGDEDCVNDHTQLMVGEDVLVAPVISEGHQQRSVYLPKVEGGWYEFDAHTNTAKLIEGGQRVSVDAPLGYLPVFVRVGAALPIAKQWESDSPHDATELTLVVFAGNQAGVSQRTIFSDDGESWNYQQEKGSMLNIDVRWDEKSVVVVVSEQWSGEHRPFLDVLIVGLNEREVSIVLPK